MSFICLQRKKLRHLLKVLVSENNLQISLIYILLFIYISLLHKYNKNNNENTIFFIDKVLVLLFV